MTTLLPPRPSITLVDEKGLMTRPWTLYFEAVFERLGGAVAPSNDNLLRMLAAAIPARQGDEEIEPLNVTVVVPPVQPAPITFIMLIEEFYDDPVFIPLR